MASRRACEVEAVHVALNPSALKLQITSRTRSSLVNATFAIATARPAPALIIVDLTHPQTFSHRPTPSDQHP
jgi:hypothetical protein